MFRPQMWCSSYVTGDSRREGELVAVILSRKYFRRRRFVELNSNADMSLWICNLIMCLRFQLKHLISCCCRRKRFLITLNKSLGPLMLRALRDDETCQQILCAMLELDVVESNDMQLQIITTLQSTSTGKAHYNELCQRQLHLKELVIKLLLNWV